MQDVDDTPSIQIDALNADTVLREVRMHFENVAWPARAEIEVSGIGASGRPLNLAINPELIENLTRLLQITTGVRSGDMPFIAALPAVRPKLREVPITMIQQQAGERE
jgi:hypothetical protein